MGMYYEVQAELRAFGWFDGLRGRKLAIAGERASCFGEVGGGATSPVALAVVRMLRMVDEMARKPSSAALLNFGVLG